MKKSVLILLCLAAVGALVWFVWLRPARPADEEPAVVTEVPVRAGKITRATLRGYVTAYGTVEPEPAGENSAASARVAPSVAGVVTAVNCAEGRRVEAGAVLFKLDSRAADVAVAFAEQVLDRQRKLMQVEGSSQKALQEAEQQLATARAQQALLTLRAPLAGTVVRVTVAAGEAVDLTTVLAEIVDLDRLVVAARVPTTELAGLKAGQPAEALADKSATAVSGSLTFISQQVDAKTDTVVVRAAIPAGSGLRPGQFVTVRIVSEEHKDCLAVPVESLVHDAEGGEVIALIQGDKAVQKPVKAGLRDGDLIEIEAAGLKAGDAVVTVGAYGLPKETKIRVLDK